MKKTIEQGIIVTLGALGIASAAQAAGPVARSEDRAGAEMAKAQTMAVPILNWTAPQFMNLPATAGTNLSVAATAAPSGPAGKPAGGHQKVQLDLATLIPLPPCRLVDTRGLFNPVYGSGGPFASFEVRVYRASGNCGIPAGNNRVKGVSLAVTTMPTPASGDVEVVSESAPLGGTVLMVIQAGLWNSATTVSPVDAEGDIKVQVRLTAADMAIDVNGYYAAPDPANTADLYYVNGNYNADGGLLYVQTASTIGAAVRGFGPNADVRLAQGNNAIDVADGGLRVRGAGANTDTMLFRHVVDTAGSFGAGGTLCNVGTPTASVIDNTTTNGNPNALLIITPRALNSVGPAPPIGKTYFAIYDDTGACVAAANNKWLIKTVDGSALVNGQQFNVLVATP